MGYKGRRSGTDFSAVEHQQVPITPLQIDLTHTTQLTHWQRPGMSVTRD
jgi:broad specificity polyphosphatase/5'/3'-nucleotidase SurE